MANYILSLDQGTTSSRAILFDVEGHPVDSAQQEFKQHYPQPGWVEHDPEDIWRSQSEVMAEVLRSQGVSANELAGIGITNQRETTLLWDRLTGEPLHNAIVWQDRRTAEHIDRLKAEGLEATFQQKTGLVLDAYFSGSKISWLLEHVPGARERAERGELAFGTVDSWLIYRLSGGEVHVTDVTNASRTLLFNIHKLDWDGELLEIFGIPRSLLPEVRSSSEVYCHTRHEALPNPVPVAGIAGDQQAATFGQSCFEAGQGKNTYGTGCFLMLNTGSSPIPSKNQLLTTVAWQQAGDLKYALEGSIFVAGAVVQWLRDELGLISRAEDVERLASSVPDSGGVVLVPAFTGLGAPHWDQYARGTILGLTRGTGAAHLARAALEGIAYQVSDVIRAMESDSGVPLSELRVDGGASQNDLLMQFQADILGVPVVRPKVTETTALGAAYLAGLATGFWRDTAELSAHWQIERRFEPKMERAGREVLLERWRRALERAKDWGQP
ncbi:MAG: glycerol kinase GlpK [Trueperaceae bacterium]|nr:MAG: glycerol kinase GlpK [Trueperaceae bacterium]